MQKTLFTIGYEGLSQKEFIAALAAANVQVVLDVRELPLSHKLGFSKRGLADALGHSGIDYAHLPALGCPRPIRKRYKVDGDWLAYTRAFRVHLAKQSDVVRDLALRAKTASACLLCFEADYNRCHRKFVAQAAARAGKLNVVHLTC